MVLGHLQAWHGGFSGFARLANGACRINLGTVPSLLFAGIEDLDCYKYRLHATSIPHPRR